MDSAEFQLHSQYQPLSLNMTMFLTLIAIKTQIPSYEGTLVVCNKRCMDNMDRC